MTSTTPRSGKSTDAKPDAKPAAAAKPAAFDFASLTAVPLAAPPKAPNPLAPLVALSVGEGWDAKGVGTWLEIPQRVPTTVYLSVVNKLHNAAADAGHGLNTKVTKHADGTATIAYQAKRDKRESKYSADDVKAWALENVKGYVKGAKLTAAIRKSYRLANGFETAEDAS